MHTTQLRARVDEVQAAVVGMDKKVSLTHTHLGSSKHHGHWLTHNHHQQIMQMSELAKLAKAYAEAAVRHLGLLVACVHLLFLASLTCMVCTVCQGSDSAMAVSAATQRLDEAAAAQVGVIEEVEAVAAEALKRASSGAASIEELRAQVTAAHSSLAGHDTSILALDESSQAAADTVKKLVAE